ncbi:ORF6N domain-containing protein [Mucilaginibacter segetis]|uniref:ORF6N domain-containing protein n=1 Tax=Mucilaginibacter segetis TaxID=2793071 RepID=A0A934PPW9_9SPHI|nr:ORF6N domain-containing protein [Mucilaginibacter segetis]MBK0378573.1 ORF6N domain-containing protein [Mucilaginibacter segetis]
MKPEIRNDQRIAEKIYLIRGIKVMLDRDLAEMYGTIPIRLRQQVKRNSDRFPEHFMYQLTEKEVDDMVSQNVIPSRQHLGGALPYAFSELCKTIHNSVYVS